MKAHVSMKIAYSACQINFSIRYLAVLAWNSLDCGMLTLRFEMITLLCANNYSYSFNLRLSVHLNILED